MKQFAAADMVAAQVTDLIIDYVGRIRYQTSTVAVPD